MFRDSRNREHAHLKENLLSHNVKVEFFIYTEKESRKINKIDHICSHKHKTNDFLFNWKLNQVKIRMLDFSSFSNLKTSNLLVIRYKVTNSKESRSTKLV